MNLATMRTKFAQHTSDLASDLSDADIDAYLNRAYQYVIPADVGGEFNETLWELQTTAGTASYAYAASIVATSGDAPFIESYLLSSVVTSTSLSFLDIETDRTVFEYADRGGDTAQSRPASILFYGRSVLMTPIPDLDYIVKIPARGGPTAGLTSSGLGNDSHAMAVVTSASTEFLGEIGNGEDYSIQAALYDRYKGILQVYAHSRPTEREWNRSF